MTWAAGDEDNVLAVILDATDADGDPLIYTLVEPESYPKITLWGNVARYEPDPGWTGTRTFKFRAHDGKTQSNTATGTLTVRPAAAAGNQPPVPLEMGLGTREDEPVEGTLGASDPDNDPLVYELVSLPVHGTLAAGRRLRGDSVGRHPRRGGQRAGGRRLRLWLPPALRR